VDWDCAHSHLLARIAPVIGQLGLSLKGPPRHHTLSASPPLGMWKRPANRSTRTAFSPYKRLRSKPMWTLTHPLKWHAVYMLRTTTARAEVRVSSHSQTLSRRRLARPSIPFKLAGFTHNRPAIIARLRPCSSSTSARSAFSKRKSRSCLIIRPLMRP
jgi:hypothetical protein